MKYTNGVVIVDVEQWFDGKPNPNVCTEPHAHLLGVGAHIHFPGERGVQEISDGDYIIAYPIGTVVAYSPKAVADLLRKIEE